MVPLKGEGKNKTCPKATNPHPGEDFSDLNGSPHFPPLCQVRQRKKAYIPMILHMIFIVLTQKDLNWQKYFLMLWVTDSVCDMAYD